MSDDFRNTRGWLELIEEAEYSGLNNSSTSYNINGTLISLPSVSADGLIDYQSYINATLQLSGREDEGSVKALEHYLRLLESASVIEELVKNYSYKEPDLDWESVNQSPSSRIAGQGLHASLRALASQFEGTGLGGGYMGPPAGAYAIVLSTRNRSLTGNFSQNMRINERSSVIENLSRDSITIKDYSIFVLSNVGASNPIPTVEGRDITTGDISFNNMLSYPIARLSGLSARTGVILTPGTLVRIHLESSDANLHPIITDIVQDDPRFLTLVANSFIARSTLSPVEQAQTTSKTTVSHAQGDSPCDSACRSKRLQQGYKDLYGRVGKNIIDSKEVFEYLMNKMEQTFGFYDERLILGLLCNAWGESNFDANIISGQSGESSIGLFQFNVGSNGWISVKNAAVKKLEKAVSGNSVWDPMVTPPDNAPVIPYFMGGLLLKNGPATSGPAANLHNPNATNFLPSNTDLAVGMNIPTIITRNNYLTQFNQDPNQLIDSYTKARDWRNQCMAMLAAIKSILESTTAGIDEYEFDAMDADKWAAWILVYIEQPGGYKARGRFKGEVISRLRKDGLDSDLIRKAQEPAGSTSFYGP